MTRAGPAGSRFDLGRELVCLQLLRRDRPAVRYPRWQAAPSDVVAHMQRNHGAWLKPPKQPRGRQMRGGPELRVEEEFENRGSLVDAASKRSGDHRKVSGNHCRRPAQAARLRGVRRHERTNGGISGVPARTISSGSGVAVGPIAVQEHHQLPRRAARLRLETGPSIRA